MDSEHSKATEKFTAEELRMMGMIGLYEEVDDDEEKEKAEQEGAKSSPKKAAHRLYMWLHSAMGWKGKS